MQNNEINKKDKNQLYLTMVCFFSNILLKEGKVLKFALNLRVYILNIFEKMNIEF